MKLNKTQKHFFSWTSKLCLGIAVIIILVLALTGCGNQQLLDTTYSFDRAIVSLPNGDVVDGKLQSWKDYENSDQIQVKINGKTYLTHISNVVLIAGED